jgi:hypothetical protein
MIGIVAHLVEEMSSGRHDAIHQETIGTVEFQQRRQFVADFFADDSHGLGRGQRLMHRAQEIVEQPLMPVLLHERAQGAGGERRQIDRRQLRGDAAGDEGHQARSLGCAQRLRQQPQRETREIVALLAVAQPVGDEGGKVDLAQLGLDRAGLEEVHLDEFAELVGDAVLVALDDRGVRDR